MSSEPSESVRELHPNEARFVSNVQALGIDSTRDVDGEFALGDGRGEEALAMALGMRSAGYHIYCAGLEGAPYLERIAEIVRRHLPSDGPLHDLVFVHNFSDASRPRAIRLQAGDGARLRQDCNEFLTSLREDLPKAFREEAFDAEKGRVIDAFRERMQTEEQALNELVERESFSIQLTPQGNVAIQPMVDGESIESEEAFRALGEEKMSEINQARERLEHELQDHFERSHEERHRVDQEIHAIERAFSERLVSPRIRAIAARYRSPELSAHLEEMSEHLLDNLGPFRSKAGAPAVPPPLARLMSQADEFAIYEVNVAVDNARTDTAPTLVVDSPTYKNLFGTIDREVTGGGQVTTDFRKIRAGAILKAEGGAVVLSVEDALMEPFVWRILRRSLRSNRVEVEAYDPYPVFTVSMIRPEAVDVDTKVVLVGSRHIFELLLQADPEFNDLFKILADFSPVVELDEATTRALCGRIAALVEREDLLHFEADGLDALVELAVREAGDRQRIDLGGERVLDAAREASGLARTAGSERVSRKHVMAAVDARIHRLDRIEENLAQSVERGHVLLDVDGVRVGQLNALSVIELGTRAFGRVGRVTAAVGLGQGGVVNIEREAELSGSRHDKGILILEGLIRDRFARTRPLSLVASVAFEQSYGPIDGDSASLAELLAILSRVGELEVRQDLAVTGSINQAGEVQAVGGLNEKIEGFFDCCVAKGLTGSQGVVIPASNVENLTLREDVIAAMQADRFHIYPVTSADEALALFTGLEAGTPYEPGTANEIIDQALESMAIRLATFAQVPPS